MKICRSTVVRLLCLSVLTSLCHIRAAAQVGSSTSMANRPESVADVGALGYWTQMETQGRAGGVLLGKVVFVDEMLVWEAVPISVVCKGTVSYTTYTDSTNRFAISSSHLPGSMSLQGDAKRQMEMYLEGCLVQAMLPGFHSSTLTITHRNLREDPELGTLQLEADAATRADLSSRFEHVQGEALDHFKKAHAALMTHDTGRAQHELRKAIEIAPNFADGWYQLGRLQRASDSGDGKASFERAAILDPKFLSPRQQMMNMAFGQKQWPEVVTLSQGVMQLDPVGTPLLWYEDAYANVQLGHLDQAEISAMRSLQIDPLHTVPSDEELLALILIREKNYSEAMQHLQNCLTYLPSGPQAQHIRKQISELARRQTGSK